jgi:hypothetical protein
MELIHGHAVGDQSPLRICVQVTYSTYTEADYDAIWKHYAYLPELPDWFYKVQHSKAWWPQPALAAVWAPRIG